VLADLLLAEGITDRLFALMSPPRRGVYQTSVSLSVGTGLLQLVVKSRNRPNRVHATIRLGRCGSFIQRFWIVDHPGAEQEPYVVLVASGVPGFYELLEWRQLARVFQARNRQRAVEPDLTTYYRTKEIVSAVSYQLLDPPGLAFARP
jgi:hypothetical protein